MLFLTRKKDQLILKINEKDKFKYECIKTCAIYFIVGFLWIYISNIIVSEFTTNKDMQLITSTSKGWLYVVVTSIILYLLMNNVLKKIHLTGIKLNKSYEELSVSNKALKVQFNQIIESQEKYKALVNEMQQGLALFQSSVNEKREIINFKFLDINKSCERLMGLKKKNILGKNIFEIFPSIEKTLGEKFKYVAETGESIHCEQYIQGIGKYYEIIAYRLQKSQLAVITTDITARKQMEHELHYLQYLSYHDQLTGLYNRRFFEEELNRLDVQRNLPLTIVMADVNRLKFINDSFGHVMGDEVLKKVSEVMTKGCRTDDIIARFGGDEFVILLPKTNAYETEKIIKRIENIASKEKIGSVDIDISFGYETKKNEGEKTEVILKKADDNMYKRKYEGAKL
ncbi:diguanylate cyclase [Clostridium sp. WILCCON 0269]|uniref:Diguanylate cyclase n=1 Tax=Candidatus Clostridium eludens TaxID=3381663 RepID=A0ABW8SH78_9CLOT